MYELYKAQLELHHTAYAHFFLFSIADTQNQNNGRSKLEFFDL